MRDNSADSVSELAEISKVVRELGPVLARSAGVSPVHSSSPTSTLKSDRHFTSFQPARHVPAFSSASPSMSPLNARMTGPESHTSSPHGHSIPSVWGEEKRAQGAASAVVNHPSLSTTPLPEDMHGLLAEIQQLKHVQAALVGRVTVLESLVKRGRSSGPTASSSTRQGVNTSTSSAVAPSRPLPSSARAPLKAPTPVAASVLGVKKLVKRPVRPTPAPAQPPAAAQVPLSVSVASRGRTKVVVGVKSAKGRAQSVPRATSAGTRAVGGKRSPARSVGPVGGNANANTRAAAPSATGVVGVGAAGRSNVSVHIPTGRERKEGLSERKENVMSRKDNNVSSGTRRDSTGVQKKDSALRRRKGAAAAPTAKVEEAEPQWSQLPSGIMSKFCEDLRLRLLHDMEQQVLSGSVSSN